jgi:hypothetical protein
LTINPAKPYKGSLEIIVPAGILAANGTPLSGTFAAVVKQVNLLAGGGIAGRGPGSSSGSLTH